MARCGFPKARGGGQDLPRAETLPSAKASRHGARAKEFARAGLLPTAKASRHGTRAKEFAPRRNTPRGEGLPTRRTSERICPARERSPRRRPPDTAHEQKNLPRGIRVCPTCRRTAGRPRSTDSQKNTPSAGSHPRPRTSERICPAQERSPRRRPPDTAHERKGLPRARTLPTAKASRHGARAKGFAPRRNTPRGEGLPTRRTSERICPARERSPRRRPPDTAHGRKDLPHARTFPTAKASRHGARAKGFAPRRNTPRGEGLPTRRTGERICPAGFAFAPRADERRAALDRRTAGKTPLRRGRTRDGAAAAEFIHTEKKTTP